MKDQHIPFNKPVIAGSELERITDAIDRGQLAGDGHYTQLCEQEICRITTSPHALLTHSCTAALEMAAILLDLKEGDEVIMPSYTFVSTANAVVLRGAIPVFVDIRLDTLNIDEKLIEAAITTKTKAIFVVHYAGVICEMDEILQVARTHNLAVVEDAAQALTSTYKGRQAGSIGDIGCFSFHETKNIISGEGGAITVNNPSLVDRSEIIREKGTNRKKFFKGQVDKYTWVDIGSSYLPGELIAAFLYGQLLEITRLQKDRLQAWAQYDAEISRYSSEYNLSTPQIPEGVVHNAHLYYILVETAEMRAEIIADMKNKGVTTPFHYIPLHNSPAGKKYTRTSGELVVTTAVSEQLVRLPMYPAVKNSQERIIESLFESLKNYYR